MAFPRRLLAVILAVILCISNLPGPAFAQEAALPAETAPTEAVTEPASTEETVPVEETESIEETEASEEPEPTGETESSEETEPTMEPEPTEETEAAEETAPSEEPEEPEAIAAVTFCPAGGEIDTSQAVSVTLSCTTEGAAIFYALSADGITYGEYLPYENPIPLSPGFGKLYIKARAEKERSLSDKLTVTYYTELPASGWDLYFGSLHSHSGFSDGSGTPEQAYEAAKAAGLEFYAVTDNSNSLDGAESAVISQDATALSTEWAAGKEAAAAATNAGFVGIYGYEMSWPNIMQLGHINTFCTPGFAGWQQSAFDDYESALQNYYAALATVPESISQFNHPGTAYGDFRGFDFYTPEYDDLITLLEVGSGDLEDAYEYYTQALDLGWHVAPTNNQNTHSSQSAIGSSRTVVYAEALTEAAIYDALRHYRVYATQDSDLAIFYCLDEYFMGSLLERRDVGETVVLSAKLNDPTDSIGTVEVIVDGGEVIARETVEGPSATVTMEVPPDYHYYYLRITQPDGDTAVTAPVWIDDTEDVGIASFVSDTAVPVKGQPMHLSLSLYNNEREDLVVEAVDISIGGQVLHSFTMGTLEPGQVKRCAFSLTHNALGQTRITATVTASLGGAPRIYEENLTLSLRVPEMVTTILVDGAHGTVPELGQLRLLAEENNINLTVATEPFTTYQLSNAGMVIVPAPTQTFETEFLERMAWYASCGGRVLVCGRGDGSDGAVHAAAEGNKLLEAMGSSLRICDDTAVDSVNNGGSETALYLARFNGSWCDTVSGSQVYRMVEGCTVDPGSGTWLVKGYDTTASLDGDGDGLSGNGNVVLACEGRIFAAGSLFVSDADLAGPENIWDAPYANRAIIKALLGDTRQELPLTSIAEARAGEPGEVYRIRGYVTAGNANAANTFPDLLYVQDDTGGIAVTPFSAGGISVGTPLDIVGTLEIQGENRVFAPISWEVLDAAPYKYEPLEGLWDVILVPETHGGRLVQVQGEAVQILYSGDTLSEILLKDKNGNQAIVHVEDYIRSGSTGENTLSEEILVGRTVRAYGIVHVRADGKTVIRVRNCDEVVYVPPIHYVWKPAKDDNPRVGDSIGIWFGAFALSSALLLKKRRRK